MPARAWIRLPSGRHFNLIAPDPEGFSDADLAMRLARTYRWGGESLAPLPLSVAQHSLLVLALRREMAGPPLTAAQAMLELLHDAEEGFLGFDCISPLKPVLGQAFAELSQRLWDCVAARYRLPTWCAEGHRLHKRADVQAAAGEALHTVGWGLDEIREVLGIQEDPPAIDPLAARHGEAPWQPWPADVAAERFLHELAALKRQRVVEEGAMG